MEEDLIESPQNGVDVIGWDVTNPIQHISESANDLLGLDFGMNKSQPPTVQTSSNIDTASDPYEALPLSPPVVLSSSNNYDPFANCDLAGGNSNSTTWSISTESTTNHETPNNDMLKAMLVIQENSIQSNGLSIQPFTEIEAKMEVEGEIASSDTLENVIGNSYQDMNKIPVVQSQTIKTSNDTDAELTSKNLIEENDISFQEMKDETQNKDLEIAPLLTSKLEVNQEVFSQNSQVQVQTTNNNSLFSMEDIMEESTSSQSTSLKVNVDPEMPTHQASTLALQLPTKDNNLSMMGFQDTSMLNGGKNVPSSQPLIDIPNQAASIQDIPFENQDVPHSNTGSNSEPWKDDTLVATLQSIPIEEVHTDKNEFISIQNLRESEQDNVMSSLQNTAGEVAHIEETNLNSIQNLRTSKEDLHLTTLQNAVTDVEPFEETDSRSNQAFDVSKDNILVATLKDPTLELVTSEVNLSNSNVTLQASNDNMILSTVQATEIEGISVATEVGVTSGEHESDCLEESLSDVDLHEKTVEFKLEEVEAPTKDDTVSAVSSPEKVEEKYITSNIVDETPSWASPDAVPLGVPIIDISSTAKSASDWASAAASPVPPQTTIIKEEIINLEPSLVEMPQPIEPSTYVSAILETPIPDPVTEAIIADLQATIREYLIEKDATMERLKISEEAKRQAEEKVNALEGVVEVKNALEKELQETKGALGSAVLDRENLLKELEKLREDRDEHERKQIVLSNRLNAAKKQEAAKANLAESLDDKIKVLKHELENTKLSLKQVTAEKESSALEFKANTDNFEQRIKKLESTLLEERKLNEERKKKMKTFVENKQEEVREAKAQNDELNLELSQTNRSLREHHSRWKQLHAQWVQSQTRNRELQRDINRMKKESENMSRMGDQMNEKLSQRAQETETHKNKRLTAKQELMTVLETLESEREVSNKLQDSIKFTFTPKALSQQQLLRESLRDFEHELMRLSQRLGRPLPPFQEVPAETTALHDDEAGEEDEGGGNTRRSRSQIDAAHLLSHLEDETQRVSQCIMALSSNIERMHVLISQSGERTCATLFTDLLLGASTSSSTGEHPSSFSSGLGMGTNQRYGQLPSLHE
jgi:hypothetical protein